ncbi:MAG: endonuclease MutS2 [Defluviitaleaceae bacterium]|nr:endonuclease MutS2 [Defluviitaleaceae bacterium]
MNEAFYKPLEYAKILEKLEKKAISSSGKNLAINLKPSINVEEIQKNQNETTTAVDMILKKGSLPLGGIKDIAPILYRSYRGGILNISELLWISDFLHVCKKVYNYSIKENKDDVYTLLEEYFEEIQLVSSLENKINKCISNETELKDDASTELASLRRQIKQSNTKIKDQLNNIIQSTQYKTMLQDSVVTMRNGRFCVPVKQEYKGSFSGIIHDQSSTGATVFIEPVAVVNLNNKIKELLLAEKEEIDKILKNLSEVVTENHDILKNNLDFITILDLIFAKGELSLEMNAVEPKINTHGYINIEKGRHPLIDKDKVVPLNIYIGDKFSTLLITGPNTGGKTVSLKILGLFNLMGQAGLHLPCTRCEISVFDNIFADIGDEQSIEQSLSTFSSHMKNIVKILDLATSKSLVLLDELGAGTDPIEGAALAISILDYLKTNKIRAAVTTHYSQLKVYALTTNDVENASCEFDINTLAPTYKLLIGVPGKSNAFAISKKLGLSENIIAGAKTYLSNDEEKLEDVIADLETSKKTTIIEQERALFYKKEAEKLKQDLEKQRQKFEQKKEKILKKAKEDATEILKSAENHATEIIKEMVAKSTRVNVHEMDLMRKSISSKIEEFKPKKKKKKPIKKLSIGDRVFIETLGQTGIVSSLPNSNGEVLIKSGIMKIKANISELSIDNSEDEQINSPSVKATIKSQKSKNISSTVDIRGTTASDGLEILQKYLDDVYLAGLKQVTIIHGKGSGILRTSVQKYLSKNSNIKSFRAGVFGEGDSGVTVVQIN